MYMWQDYTCYHDLFDLLSCFFHAIVVLLAEIDHTISLFPMFFHFDVHVVEFNL